jgi:L-lactate dehydrogenase complex protein LldE
VNSGRCRPSIRKVRRVEAVALFVTCVGDLIEPDVPLAAVAVLRACGATVSLPDGQTCCGQPAWNAGFAAEAAAVARTSLEALEREIAGDETMEVVVPAGSCATMIRLYWPALFDAVNDPSTAERARRVGERVREFTEWVAPRAAALPPMAAARPSTIAYHRSCHMQRELHVTEAPLDLLAEVDGCEVAEWEADDRCCGFGGTFSVKLPEVSAAMADDKLDTLPAGVVEVVGADASCLLQIRTRAQHRGLPVSTRHVAQVLRDALPEAGSP